MKIGKKVYERNFISQTKKGDFSPHASGPTSGEYEDHSEEDNDLRKKIIKDYALHPTKEVPTEKIVFLGFDGKQQYRFEISGYPLAMGVKTENIQYTTTISIKKTGSRLSLHSHCDLENFLINKGFKLSKDK